MISSLYLIFGNGNTGKSTIIRALTGLRTSSIIKLSLVGESPASFFVCMTSLQEGNFVIPSELEKYMNSHNEEINNFIFPIRINGTNDCPYNAEDYLLKINDLGVVIKGVALLSSTIPAFCENFKLNINDSWIKHPLELPRNHIAMIIRNKWGLE